MAIVTDLKIGDEIGLNQKIVWMLSYQDKELRRVIWFITLNRRGTFDIILHNYENMLGEYRLGYSKLEPAVKEVFEVMKLTCKTKYKPH